ncbi:hypothetical protein QTP70_012173 [Hemibagrus guttatus]|uniref:Chromo domain-containing protein n=1 Tax=Hemibagrus guttatus TaxID=175788 RepID=A0AAE0ULH8_9TELE|nr:hypothetical protein QTP70_012173 [Hemibagrus guttatus]
MEGILHAPGCGRQSIIGVPPSNKRADRKEDPGDQPLPPYLLSRPPGLVEPVPGLGQVRTKFPPSTFYRSDSLPVCARLPATTLPWSGEPSDVPVVDHWFRKSERVWGSAHHQLQRALHRRRLTADRRRSDAPAYQPGQKVWLSTRDIRLRLFSRKLSPRFIGPFTILKQVNPVTYKLQLPRGYRIHPTFHVSLLKPHHPSVLPSTEPGEDAAKPPLPLLLDDGTTYGVKEILDSRRCGGRLEYLVDWEGYGPEERSWILHDDVLDPDLLTTFHATHPHRPAPRGRGRPPRRQGPRPTGAGREGGYCHRHARL